MKRSLIILGIIVILIFVLFFIWQSRTEQNIVKVGAILALSGDAAKYGEASRNSIALETEEINKKGGIKGKKLKIIYEDSQGYPEKSVSSFRKLVEIDNVKFILGPLSSPEVLAIAPLAEKKKIIILSPSASAQQISQAGDYIFRNVMSDEYDGRAMASYAFKELKKRRAAIFYINNDFGLGLANSFIKKFKSLAGEIVIALSYERGEKDFRTQITKIKDARPDSVFLVGYSEMSDIIKQEKELGAKLSFLSFSMFEDPNILKLIGDAAENVYYTFRYFDTETKEGVVDNFVNTYKKKYNSDPDIFAALSYDAICILTLALEKGNFRVEEVKNALYSIKDFPGVMGKLSFDKNGDVISPIGVKKIENNQFVWVIKKFNFE